MQMAKTTLIIIENGKTLYFVQESLTNAIKELKKLSNEAVIQFCNIAGIDAFKIYQNYTNQIQNCIQIFELFENMQESEIAKCMLLAVKQRLDILETPKHLHLIKHAQRIGHDDTFKNQAPSFMNYLQWQGFEFIGT